MYLQRFDDRQTILLILFTDFEPVIRQVDVGKKLGVIIPLSGLEEQLDFDQPFREVARVTLKRNGSELRLLGHRLWIHLRAVKLVEHLNQRIAVRPSGAKRYIALIGYQRQIFVNRSRLPRGSQHYGYAKLASLECP